MGALIIAPIILMFAPADYFDQGQSISLFALLGVENYYSEGLTRASMHLLHFDFKGAAAYNKISFVVVPLLMIVWGSAIWRSFRRIRFEMKRVPEEKLAITKTEHEEEEKHSP
jgi:hypothetical protein